MCMCSHMSKVHWQMPAIRFFKKLFQQEISNISNSILLYKLNFMKVLSYSLWPIDYMVSFMLYFIALCLYRYALESITEGKFSHKSDVWSYGITLWEMFSYGENPEIPGVPDAALNEALQQGHRLRMTEHCPALVYSLMRSCWEKDSHDRPTFTNIIQRLQVLHSELCS